MDLLDVARLHSSWSNLRQTLRLLERWDAPRGILFESHDESANDVVRDVAQYLGGRNVDLDRKVSKSEWDKNVQRFLDGGLPPDAVKALDSERICLIVCDLESRPEWLLFRIKGLMELTAKRPFCCLATTNDAKQVNDSVRSFFHVSRKIGRPRAAPAS